MVNEQIYQKEKVNNLMISILSHIVEFRNEESGLHVLHIQTMTEILLKSLMRKTDKYKLDRETINLISNASTLHDVGKICIPSEILNKPGRFTDEEFAIMKQHSQMGADMMKGVPFQDEPLVKYAYEICRWHHERYDGRGYPDGAEGVRRFPSPPRWSAPGRRVRRPDQHPGLQARPLPREGPDHDSQRRMRHLPAPAAGVPGGEQRHYSAGDGGGHRHPRRPADYGEHRGRAGPV